MMNIDTALDELLLTRPVAENDILQAHRRMALRFHPDKASDPDEKRWVQQKFLRIQEAYELLKGLPIETINGSPDRRAPLDNGASPPDETQQPEYEEQDSSGSVVALDYLYLLLFGLLLLLYGMFALGSGPKPQRPQSASGAVQLAPAKSPLPDTPSTATRRARWLQEAQEEAIRQQQEEELWNTGKTELQRTFGHLLKIEQGTKGRVAYFEWFNQPVCSGQTIRGFEVHVDTSEVTFARGSLAWTTKLPEEHR